MIAIISACGANFSSVIFACERLGKEVVLTEDPEIIFKASHVILPGVGTALQAMNGLKKANLEETICNLKQPVLGICLGMQILFEYSTESEIECLNIIPGRIESLANKNNMSIPHMGWNQLNITKSSDLLKNIDIGEYVYYVHSYRAGISEHTIATTKYTENFSAVVNYNNFYGVQFHPERSGKVGAQILNNFLELT